MSVSDASAREIIASELQKLRGRAVSPAEVRTAQLVGRLETFLSFPWED